MEAMARAIPHFVGRITDHLRADDDPKLWQTAVETIIAEAGLLCHRYRGKSEIFTQIGSCSHWMSPHNKGSWFPDVRFAQPLRATATPDSQSTAFPSSTGPSLGSGSSSTPVGRRSTGSTENALGLASGPAQRERRGMCGR